MLLITLAFLFNNLKPHQEPEIAPQRELNQIVGEYAIKYSVSPIIISQLVFCESSNNPQAHNKNDFEDSWGYSQINIKVHNVTIEQATDADFAIDFMAKNIAKGKVDMWKNCWNKINE